MGRSQRKIRTEATVINKGTYMDNSKLPAKDKDEKSLWTKLVDWNQQAGEAKKKRALQRRIKTNAVQQRYKKKKGNQ